MSTIAKKRANGDGTIRQRKDGRWELIVPMGRNPGTGKLIRKSYYFATQKEAAATQRRITHERDEGVYTAPTKMTVGGWLDQWHRDYLGGVKESTAANTSSISAFT